MAAYFQTTLPCTLPGHCSRRQVRANGDGNIFFNAMHSIRDMPPCFYLALFLSIWACVLVKGKEKCYEIMRLICPEVAQQINLQAFCKSFIAIEVRTRSGTHAPVLASAGHCNYQEVKRKDDDGISKTARIHEAEQAHYV